MSTTAEYKFTPTMYTIGDMAMPQMPMDDTSAISECNVLDSSGDLQSTTEENVSFSATSRHSWLVCPVSAESYVLVIILEKHALSKRG